MFRVVETFSGIGAQAKALERIGKDFDIVNTCEWDINAILAYCLIHKGKIDETSYQKVSDDEIDHFLRSSTLSMDGKKPINPKTFERFQPNFKRTLYAAIKETKNLLSITDVKEKDIPDNVDLLTYSFPCQDLSLCGAWHGNMSGISREAHNRSGMLWEVERILKEMFSKGRELPKFLIMENVPNILSQTHKADFDDWKNTLVEMGYYNQIYRLNAKNFGVPQKRERAYMLSIHVDNDDARNKLASYFSSEENNLMYDAALARFGHRNFGLQDVLRVDYTNPIYKMEADESQPNDTPSRKKIYEENDMLYQNGVYFGKPLNTVTTKQDRNPNSGLVSYDSGRVGKSKWRYLTPRECFMLMGFDEEDFNRAISNDLQAIKDRKLFTVEKLVKMAGNSICVDVLEAIFKQIFEIKESVL